MVPNQRVRRSYVRVRIRSGPGVGAQSRDQALEQAQSALQRATFRAAEANERNQRELAEVHAKLEARESELAAVRLRLADAEDGWANRMAEAGTSRAGTPAAAGLVNMDVDRVMWRLMERV
jgi:division protein CdvB (Snf7/Vps24/ESCRT-III family)